MKRLEFSYTDGEIQDGAASLKNSRQFIEKLDMELPRDPAMPFLMNGEVKCVAIQENVIRRQEGRK